MTLDKDKKGMDYKQVGGGAAAGGGIMAVILALFQQQGVSMMADKYQAEVRVAIEKSLENSNRIDRLETRISDGFKGVKEEVGKIAEIVRDETKDRYTRRDHDNYARRIEARFEKIEDKILLIKTEILRKGAK